MVKNSGNEESNDRCNKKVMCVKDWHGGLHEIIQRNPVLVTPPAILAKAKPGKQLFWSFMMVSALPPSDVSDLWTNLVTDAKALLITEPALTRLLTLTVTARTSFADGLSYLIAQELADVPVPESELRTLIRDCHADAPEIVSAAGIDLAAVVMRDPAVHKSIEPFLFFKGYHALQAWRVSHWLWHRRREALALYMQSRIARRYAVDIHPAAKIGQGVMFDHAHGIVIGETAVVEDNVSFLHSVTLGGTGKERGDRHPKIRSGVMIGAGAKVLGNIEVGRCARVAAGSVVLEDVPANVTVAGVPARVVGTSGCEEPANAMDQTLNSFA